MLEKNGVMSAEDAGFKEEKSTQILVFMTLKTEYKSYCYQLSLSCKVEIMLRNRMRPL